MTNRMMWILRLVLMESKTIKNPDPVVRLLRVTNDISVYIGRLMFLIRRQQQMETDTRKITNKMLDVIKKEQPLLVEHFLTIREKVTKESLKWGECSKETWQLYKEVRLDILDSWRMTVETEKNKHTETPKLFD